MINHILFSLIQATVVIVTRKQKGGNQSAQAALGQTCCHATEYFDIQEQRLSKPKYADKVGKQKKKGRYCWVIVCGTFILLNYGVAVVLLLKFLAWCTEFVCQLNDFLEKVLLIIIFIFFYKNNIGSLTNIAFRSHDYSSLQ